MARARSLTEFQSAFPDEASCAAFSITRLNGKTYPRHLLRETYREDGKVKHRTLANLTHCKPEEVEAIRLALKHKGDLGRILASAVEGGPELKQGLSVGAVWVLAQLARELGLAAFRVLTNSSK